MTYQQPFTSYEILERVGSGAMGTVFKARHRTLNRIVALKVLKPSLARDARYVDRLRREARIVAALSHPNIVTGYDLGEEAGYHYFVMEYVEGKSLKDLLGEWGSFPEEQVLDVAIQIASALDHAYQKGVIHRDVKPGNVLIDPRGRVKLTDMGLAKGPTDLTITSMGATVGTPQYISPEQARDPQSADVRSDLYSLGATLFHMATGQPPFAAQTLAEVLTKVLAERPPTAHGINPSLSEGLSLVIRKLLAKDPGLRYQTPAELLLDLGRVRRSERPEVDLALLEEVYRRSWPRRVRRAALPVGAMMLLVALVVFVFARNGSQPGPSASERLAAELDQKLDQKLRNATGFRDMLNLLEREAGAQTAPELAAVVRVKESTVESLFCADVLHQLDELAADQDGARAELQRQEAWRDPAGALRERAARSVWERHLYRLESLPARVRAELERRLTEMIASLQPLVLERDRQLVAQLRDHLQAERPQEWISLLDQREFALAENALRATIDDFYGRDGRPAKDWLAAPLRARVEELERGALESGRDRIEREEQQVAELLRKEGRGAIALLRQQLATESPSVLLQEAQRRKAELEEHYPRRAFRRVNDPWFEHDAEWRAFEQKARTELDGRELVRLQNSLDLAYGNLLEVCDPEASHALLAGYEFEGEQTRAERDRHLEILEAARDARTHLYETLQRDHGGVPAALRKDDGVGTLVLEPDDKGRRQLWRRRGNERIGQRPAKIPWPELVDAAGSNLLRGHDAESVRRLHVGLGFWFAIAGNRNRALREFEHDRGRYSFLAESVLQRLLALKPPDADRIQRGAVFAELRRALKNHQVTLLAEALRVAKERMGSDPTQDETETVRAAEAWLSRERKRTDLEQGLAQRLPAATVSVSPEGDVRVVYEPKRLAGLVESGWAPAEQALAFGLADCQVNQALACSLTVPTGLERANGVVAELRVRFPSPGSAPRLYLFELHGIGLALGLLQDGSAFAQLVDADTWRKPEAFAAAMQPQLESALETSRANAFAQAQHQIRIELKATGRFGQVRAQIQLDAMVLRTNTVQLPTRPQGAAALRITPLQPLELLEIALHGRL